MLESIILDSPAIEIGEKSTFLTCHLCLPASIRSGRKATWRWPSTRPTWSLSVREGTNDSGYALPVLWAAQRATSPALWSPVHVAPTYRAYGGAPAATLRARVAERGGNPRISALGQSPPPRGSCVQYLDRGLGAILAARWGENRPGSGYTTLHGKGLRVSWKYNGVVLTLSFI